MLCIGFVFSLVGGRLVQLQAMEGPALSTHAEAFRLNTVTIPAVRGSISTADGTTLAMTVQTDLVHADPPMIIAAKRSLGSVASALAGPLGMSPAAILALLEQPDIQAVRGAQAERPGRHRGPHLRAQPARHRADAVLYPGVPKRGPGREHRRLHHQQRPG